MTNPFYTDPLAAAYMAREFEKGVEEDYRFLCWLLGSFITGDKGVISDKDRKRYEKYDEELQKLESDTSLEAAQQWGRLKNKQIELHREIESEYEDLYDKRQRKGKQFFMPERGE